MTTARPARFVGPVGTVLSNRPPLRLRTAEQALPAPGIGDRDAWSAAAASAVIALAEHERSTPWPTPLARDAARVHTDGDRVAWETPTFARIDRVARSVIAAAATDDPTWIDDVVDGIVLLCEQSSWCWPAHDDTLTRHDSVLATVTDPYLDLGAGEVAATLAWLDHVLGIRLDERYPGVRARVRHEVRTRVIDPFVARRDWHWLGLDGDVHNWNPWIHGNVLVAALALLDDPADANLRWHVVDLVIEGIDRYLAVLPADGAVDEGYAYWWNGACRALEALDVLAFATDGAIDEVFDGSVIPSIAQTVAFPHRMHLGGEWYLNVADGQARPNGAMPWVALHRAARRVGDDQAAQHAAAHRHIAPVAREGLGRLILAHTDTAWTAAADSTAPLPATTWLPSVELFLARSTAGTATGLAVAVKGGHNGEHHNHNDVGSIVVASDGVPVIVDAGRPTYTAATFGPDRYDAWPMQSGWHSTAVIGGREQFVGRDAMASDVDVELHPDRDSISMRIDGAYPPNETTVPWTRTVELDRVSGRVTVDDSCIDAPGSQIRLLLAGTVTLAADAAVVTPIDPHARPIRISWSAGTAHLTPRALDDPMLTSVWGDSLVRLDITVPDEVDVRITVQLVEPRAEDIR